MTKQAKTTTSKNTKRATPKSELAAVVKGKSVISHERKVALLRKKPDGIRVALREAMLGSEAALVAVAHENNVEFRWAARNPGMQAMNLGNVLRGIRNRGGKVRVEGRVITD